MTKSTNNKNALEVLFYGKLFWGKYNFFDHFKSSLLSTQAQVNILIHKQLIKCKI